MLSVVAWARVAQGTPVAAARSDAPKQDGASLDGRAELERFRTVRGMCSSERRSGTQSGNAPRTAHATPHSETSKPRRRSGKAPPPRYRKRRLLSRRARRAKGERELHPPPRRDPRRSPIPPRACRSGPPSVASCTRVTRGGPIRPAATGCSPAAIIAERRRLPPASSHSSPAARRAGGAALRRGRRAAPSRDRGVRPMCRTSARSRARAEGSG